MARPGIGGALDGLDGLGGLLAEVGTGGAPDASTEGTGGIGLGVRGEGNGGSDSGEGAAASSLTTCSSAIVRVITSGEDARGGLGASSSMDSLPKGDVAPAGSFAIPEGRPTVSVAVSSAASREALSASKAAASA